MSLKPEHAPRTNWGPKLYEAAFGPVIEGAQLIADIGAGDNMYADDANRAGKQVYRYDAQYATDPPQGEAPYVAADARDLDMVPDETFDATVSACMMQHLTGKGDIAAALKEMIRITKTAGSIAVYPVWQADKLAVWLDQEFDGIASVGYAHSDGIGYLKDRNMVQRPTLCILKAEELSPERIDMLAQGIEDMKALRKRQTPRTLARAALIQLTGNTHSKR